MAIKNSQSKRMALANMLKQRSIYNQRMANFMSPTGAPGGLQSLTNPGNVPQNTGINQLLRPAQSSLSNIYNPSVQPTGPTGLTSNFYDPSYGIDRGFADQMTARNKAMQGMDAGQIQYDPVNKSFFSVGAMGQRGGPALQGTYDQMYRKYDVQNQLRGLGTPSSLTPMQLTPMQQAGVAQAGVWQAGTNPFNAAQIDFMNKNQDVFGGGSIKPMTSQPNTTQPPDQGGQQAARYISPEERNSMEAYYRQDGINQANRPRFPNLPSMDAGFGDPRGFNGGAAPALNTQASGAGAAALGQPTQAQSVRPPLGGGYVNSGKVNQPMPLSTFVDPIRSFNNRAAPALNTQVKSAGLDALGSGANSGKVNQSMPSTGYPKMNDTGFGDARGYANNGVTSANIGQATQSYPKQSQAPARRPVNRGKLNQLMPTPGV